MESRAEKTSDLQRSYELQLVVRPSSVHLLETLSQTGD